MQYLVKGATIGDQNMGGGINTEGLHSLVNVDLGECCCRLVRHHQFEMNLCFPSIQPIP